QARSLTSKRGAWSYYCNKYEGWSSPEARAAVEAANRSFRAGENAARSAAAAGKSREAQQAAAATQAGLQTALGAWVRVLAADAAYNQGECQRVCETQQMFATYAGLALFSIGAIAAIIGSCGIATPGVIAAAGVIATGCTVAGAGVSGYGIGSAIRRQGIEHDPDYTSGSAVRDVSLGVVGVGFAGLGRGIEALPGIGAWAGRSVAWSAGVPIAVYRGWHITQY
ncbi:MAG: hypothetical protein LLG24_05820, partial [Actinomycetia bacterium]|nr:hypothetical protein [Actinomycetes bacterium]